MFATRPKIKMMMATKRGAMMTSIVVQEWNHFGLFIYLIPVKLN